MSFEPLSFEPIKDDERSVLNSDAQLHILTLFETAINTSSYPNIDEKAKRFVIDLAAFAPEGKSGLDADAAASATWKVLINTASCIPCRHYGQDVLVKIVSLLGAAGGTWKDYPGFGIAMRENWNRSPVFQLGDDDEGEFSLDEWLNLNSFVARLGKEFISFGLWELRNGLEGLKTEGKSTPEAVVNTRILVATEWIIQGGRGLLRESSLNALSHEPNSGSPWSDGPLFPGTKGFNLERWGFCDQYSDSRYCSTDQVRNIYSLLASSFLNKDLQVFRDTYGASAFVCRHLNCVFNTDGFESPSQRAKHESQHHRRFRCAYSSYAFETGFVTRNLLNKHNVRYHVVIGEGPRIAESLAAPPSAKEPTTRGPAMPNTYLCRSRSLSQ